MTIKAADWGYRILRKMPSAEQATLVEKIILYLGEYIDESTVEQLQMAWKSISTFLIGSKTRIYGEIYIA